VATSPWNDGEWQGLLSQEALFVQVSYWKLPRFHGIMGIYILYYVILYYIYIGIYDCSITIQNQELDCQWMVIPIENCRSSFGQRKVWSDEDVKSAVSRWKLSSNISLTPHVMGNLRIHGETWYPLVTVCYGKWMNYSWFTHKMWLFSIVFCVFTRGYTSPYPRRRRCKWIRWTEPTKHVTYSFKAYTKPNKYPHTLWWFNIAI